MNSSLFRFRFNVIMQVEMTLGLLQYPHAVVLDLATLTLGIPKLCVQLSWAWTCTQLTLHLTARLRHKVGPRHYYLGSSLNYLFYRVGGELRKECFVLANMSSAP